MSARAAVVAAALAGVAAGSSRVARADPIVARDGDGAGTSIVATPGAIARGFVVPAVPTDPLRFPDGVIGLRFGTTLAVGTPLEAAGAWAFFRSPLAARERYLFFRTIGDLALPRATRFDVARVGADAARPLAVPSDGWAIVCFTCDGAEVVAALTALGARAMAPWAWQRMREAAR